MTALVYAIAWLLLIVLAAPAIIALSGLIEAIAEHRSAQASSVLKHAGFLLADSADADDDE